ncbi:MAG: cysteine desulfurase [Dehalococcoidia bacterium]|nr:cysteine desulfurase [Chloroflexota bacterium]MCZ6867172.1 cysteine desulfurase [Chloroflexota bacterium]
MLDVAKIRRDFPILSKLVYGKPLVYLDNAATSQKPSSVIQALVDYYEGYNANVHRGVHALSMESTQRYEEAREKVVRFIGAPDSENLIFVRNTTEGINLVASTWAAANIGPGDEILLTEMEHHSNLVPWQRLAKDKDARLRFIPVTDEGTLDLSNLDALLNHRTKLVSMTHMSNVLGTINPVKDIAQKAHAVGALILIDAAQSVPHMPVNVTDLGCDFLAFSSHKMLGPTGIGGLYVSSPVLEQMEPFLSGGEMVQEVTFDSATWNDLPMRFEAGTPNIAGTIGLGAAVDYLESLGMDQVREHETQLTGYALDALKELSEDFNFYGPADLSIRGGIISFYSPDVHPHDLGTLLDQEGIAIRAGHHCAMPLTRDKLGVAATARASFYIYNTEEEVDLLVSTLKKALRYFSKTPTGTTRSG